jgi:hypothetical protein
MTARASEIAQVRGNGFAQIRVATARCMPQQMSTLLCKYSGPEPFPNIDGKFINGRESGNQGNARPGAQRAEIKLRPRPLIRNRSRPSGGASTTLDQPICFQSVTTDSSHGMSGKFVSSQETFRKRIRHKRSRPSLRAELTFCVKL